MFSRLAGAARSEVAAQTEERLGKDRDGKRNRLSGKRRNTPRQLRGDVPAGQRQARHPPFFKNLTQPDHAIDELALEVHGSVELRTSGDIVAHRASATWLSSARVARDTKT